MKHIYNCKILNKDEPKVEFEQLYSENTQQQKIILKRFEGNMKIRNENLDPLHSKQQITYQGTQKSQPPKGLSTGLYKKTQAGFACSSFDNF